MVTTGFTRESTTSYIPFTVALFSLVLFTCRVSAELPIALNQQCDSDSFRAGLLFVLENKSLRGSVVETLTADSALSCARECLRKFWCISTNYKKSSTKDNCELNNKGLIGNEFNNLGADGLLSPSSSHLFSQLRPLQVRCSNLVLELLPANTF